MGDTFQPDDDVVLKIAADAAGAVNTANLLVKEYEKIGSRISTIIRSITTENDRLQKASADKEKEYYISKIKGLQEELAFLQRKGVAIGKVAEIQKTAINVAIEGTKNLAKIEQERIKTNEEAIKEQSKLDYELQKQREKATTQQQKLDLQASKDRERLMAQQAKDEKRAFAETDRLNKQQHDLFLRQTREKEAAQRQFLTSAGFGLVATSRFAGSSLGSIPARVLGSEAIGYGIGGGMGVAGAAAGTAVGLGIGATIAGASQLINLYSELAKKAFDIRIENGKLDSSYQELQRALDEGLTPALSLVQKTEEEFFQSLNDNKDSIVYFGGQIADLIGLMNMMARYSLLATTGTTNLGAAMKEFSTLMGGLGGATKAAFAGQNPLVGFFTGARAAYVGTPAAPFVPAHQPSVDFHSPEENEQANSRQLEQEQKLQNLRRENEELAIKIRFIREELDIKLKILDLERRAMIARNQYDINAANGVYSGPFMGTIGAQRQSQLSIAGAQNAGSGAVMGALSNLSQAQANLRERNANLARANGLGISLTNPDWKPEQVQQAKKLVEEAKLAVMKADSDLHEAKIKATDQETQAVLDGIVAITAAREAADKAEQQANVAMIGARLNLEIQAFQKQMALQRQFDEQTGRGEKWKISDIMNSGTISSNSYSMTPGVGGVPYMTQGLPTVSPTALGLANLSSLRNRTSIVQGAASNVQADRESLDLQLKLAKTEEDRYRIRTAILANKQQETGLDNLQIELLRAQQSEVEKQSPEWQNIEHTIKEIQNHMLSLKNPTQTWGDQFVNTMEILSHHMREFNASLGTGVGTIGILAKSVLDLRKVQLPASQGGGAAGTITGGLKASFGSASSILTQGLPLAMGIASSVMGIISMFHDLFTKAAKAIATKIDGEVGQIVKDATTSGKLQTAIDALNAERSKAVGDLSGRKGGQTQLNTLLPKIDDELNSIKQKQKDIVDTFAKALHLLDYEDPMAKLITDFDTVNTQVLQFINAAGESQATYDQAFQFIEKSANKLSGALDKQIADELKAWTQGAEDSHGNLIDLETDALNKKIDNDKKYNDTITQLYKQEADLRKANDKAEIDDLKKIEDLRLQIVDLNNKELLDIAAIQNQGIATRQIPTEDAKRQAIADLQDANKKQRDAMATQIDDILDARVARQAAFLEQIDQLHAAGQAALEEHNATFDRINNEMQRARDAHNEKLAQLEEQKQKILELENEEGGNILALEKLWLASHQAIVASYNNTIDSMIDANSRLMSSSIMAASTLSTISVGSMALHFNNGTSATAGDIQNAVEQALRNVAQKVPIQ